MLERVALVGVLAGCKPLPPAPFVAFHGDTAASPRGTTTAMLVVGVAGELLGGGGVGTALRVEHQETTRTTLGLELVAGRGDSDDHNLLFALRGYGRGTPRSHDTVALTYGLGISYLDVGLVTLTLHGGGAVSYPTTHASPFLGFGLATAIPLRRGGRFGDNKIQAPCFACSEPQEPMPPEPPDPVRADLFVYVDAGGVAILGASGNRISLDAGLAIPVRADEGLLSLSLADTQRFEP